MTIQGDDPGESHNDARADADMPADGGENYPTPKLSGLLRDLVGQYGYPRMMEYLGVSRSTIYRAVKSGQLSEGVDDRLRELLRNWFGEGAVVLDDEAPDEGDTAELWTRVEQLEDRVEELERDNRRLSRELEEVRAARQAPPVWDGRAEGARSLIDFDPAQIEEGHKGLVEQLEVVSLEPQAGEEYGGNTEVVASWREAVERVSSLRKGTDHLATIEAEVRQRELEVRMIGDLGLTLDPAVQPYPPAVRRDELRWRTRTLERLRRQRAGKQRWKRMRRVLSFGLWKW